MSKQSRNPRAAQFFEFEDKPPSSVPRTRKRRKKQSRNKTNPNAAKFFVFEEKPPSATSPNTTFRGSGD